jgi:L-iditol 2-dehydrogenase
MGASATHRVSDPAAPPPRELAPGGLGFDALFECTGRPEVWETALFALRRGGTMVLFGGCPPGTRVSYDTHRLHYDEITLGGSFHFTPADVRVARDILAGGELPVSGLISGTYPLARLETALKRLARGQGIKYAIVPPDAAAKRERSVSRPGTRSPRKR